MGGGYTAFGAHPWHHYYMAGSVALLQAMVIPLLLMLFLIGCRAWRRTLESLSRHNVGAANTRALAHRARTLPPVLASDAERDQMARHINHAVGEGRLSIEEGGERVDAVLRARHRHELMRLVADLPTPEEVNATRGPRVSSARAALLGVAGGLVVGAMVLQVVAGLWALWPVAVILLGVTALLPQR